MGRDKAPPYQTPPVQLLLSCLHVLSTIPHKRKVEAMRSTAEHFRALHASMDLPAPLWVSYLDYAADLEEASPTKHEGQLLIPQGLPGR